MAKKISKEYIIVDKNNCSGKISLCHVDNFCNSLSLGDQKLFESEADDGMVVGVNGVSIPLLKEFSCGSSSELENGEENREEVDALLNAEGEVSETAESPRQRRIRECMKTLRKMGGGESMDAVQVIQDTIGCVKRLQMDLLLKLQSM
ncbi:hypothetical protein SUGI_0845670 [Cryptomeria japonica]|nr:hypothetical protein SUGI_0845670 [Cryptomeria japonica]